MDQSIRIALPGRIASEPQFIDIDRSIVILGPNGTGKTRFSAQIEKGFLNEVHRITAQKSLKFPEHISGDVLEHARLLFRYGVYSGGYGRDAYPANKEKHKYSGDIATGSLNDFNALADLLFADFHQSQRNFDKDPILFRVKRIWEAIFSDKSLVLNSSSIYVDSKLNSSTYNASNMSDGEKIAFYYIGSILCAHEHAIIVVDEPEIHLHRLLVSEIWDKLETERQDCKFIYLTHDIDFAITRQRSKKIWLRRFLEENLFDYEILKNHDVIPEEIFLRIQGSTRPVIFIEGQLDSTDYKLYSSLFKNRTLLPVESCDNVIKYTSSFGKVGAFHRIRPYGIIDRDRRTDEETKKLAKLVKVLKVAECEHILLTEHVLNAVIQYKGIQSSALDKIKEIVLKCFERDIELQILEHTRHFYDTYFKSKIKAKNMYQYKYDLSKFVDSIDVDQKVSITRTTFQEYLSRSDYMSVLCVYNNKKLYQEQRILKQLKCRSGEDLIQIARNIFENGDEVFLSRLKCDLNIDLI